MSKLTRKHFTTSELKFIKQNKENMTYREIAEKLGHPKASIAKFSRRHAGYRNKSKNNVDGILS